MAFDKSEPRSGLIFQIGLFAVVCLVGIRGVLIPYFDSITSGEQHRKIGMVVPAALLNLRADEDQRLKSGPMPVDKAMEAIVARGRRWPPWPCRPASGRSSGAGLRRLAGSIAPRGRPSRSSGAVRRW